MSLEKQTGPNPVPSNVDLESLVDRLVDQAVARIGHSARNPFINSKECAELLGVTPEHLCAMRARGDGPAWSGTGKWTRYERRAVLAWLTQLPREKTLSAAPPTTVQLACTNLTNPNSENDHD